MKKSLIILTLYLFSAGCSAHTKKNINVYNDLYNDYMETGKSIFSLHHFMEAENQYKMALKNALNADDPQKIHDSSFNLIISQIRLKEYIKAKETINQSKLYLKQRNWLDTLDFDLLNSSIYYHENNWTQSFKYAQIAKKSNIPQIITAAYVLSGLSAFRMNNITSLSSDINYLSKSKKNLNTASYMELQTCLQYLYKNWQDALVYADKSINLWRYEGNYESIRRVLLLKKDIYLSLHNMSAASNLQQDIVESINNEQ